MTHVTWVMWNEVHSAISDVGYYEVLEDELEAAQLINYRRICSKVQGRSFEGTNQPVS